jgi:hypothetical protein
MATIAEDHRGKCCICVLVFKKIIFYKLFFLLKMLSKMQPCRLLRLVRMMVCKRYRQYFAPAAFDVTEGQEEPLSESLSLYSFRIYNSPIFRLKWKRMCSFAACAKIRCLRAHLFAHYYAHIFNVQLTRCWVQDVQNCN